MATLTLETAGESHGPALTTLLRGLPAGLDLDLDFINAELKRRQGGYGRGGRQRIETDRAEFVTGVRLGKTTGAPVTALVKNKDSINFALHSPSSITRTSTSHCISHRQ